MAARLKPSAQSPRIEGILQIILMRSHGLVKVGTIIGRQTVGFPVKQIDAPLMSKDQVDEAGKEPLTSCAGDILRISEYELHLMDSIGRFQIAQSEAGQDLRAHEPVQKQHNRTFVIGIGPVAILIKFASDKRAIAGRERRINIFREKGV